MYQLLFILLVVAKQKCLAFNTPGTFKNHQPRKPDSVSKLSFICDKHYCLPVAAYPGSSGGPPSNEPIHGITAPKVYPCFALLQNIVSSYLTFSPLSASWRTVIFCGTFCFRCRNPALNRLVALCCPDFPFRF